MTPDRLRILLVGNFFPSGSGAHGVCAELSAHLRDAGDEVIETSCVQRRALKAADMLATAWRRRRHYDVAHIDLYSGSAFFWADAVSRVLTAIEKPFVVTLHGGGLPAFARRRPRLVKRLLRRAAAVTAPSSFLQAAMAEYRADIRVIPNPLSIDDYTFRWRQMARPDLVWVRAFHAIYNPALAPTVVARLRHHVPDVRLTMIGPDKGDGSLAAAREAARFAGVADRVTFEGPVQRSHVARYLDQGDVFLNTANTDNTPISILEAMASGLPVVTTNVGGIPALVTDGYNARTVPPDDPEAMSAALLEVLTDRQLSSRLSANGRAAALRFDWNHVLPHWRQLFRHVA